MEFKCIKCGHKWNSFRTLEDPPKVCPRCKSYKWFKNEDTKSTVSG